MKKIISISILAIFVTIMSISANAQTVFPGKQTIDKTEYPGIVLGTNISEKLLNDYWEAYLGRFGKVKGKKGNYTINKASIPSISASPIQLTSQILSEQKNQSKIFLALFADGSYVADYSDRTYKSAESVLKEFSDYAAVREEVRMADEAFVSSEKSYQKLIREIDDKNKEIEKTEKKLADLRGAVATSKAESEKSLLDLQNKQKALETVKMRLPAQK